MLPTTRQRSPFSYPLILSRNPPEIVAAATALLEKIEPRWDAAYAAAKENSDVEALARTVGELQAEVQSFAFKTRQFIEQQWRNLCAEQRRATASTT